MINELVTVIQAQLIPLGGFGVFVASLIEEVIAPVPSVLVQMGAGFFLLPDTFSTVFVYDLAVVVVIPAALGVAIGSLFVYFLAYYAGKPLLERWSGWLGFRWEDVEHARARFKRAHADSAALFVLRTIPVVPSVAVSALCGFIRMRLWRYLLWTFLGTLIRAGALAVIGWQAGALYSRYAKQIGRYEEFVLIAGLVGALVFALWRLWRRRCRCR